jgi:CTP synthase (UTP-ammonia lyase)
LNPVFRGKLAEAGLKVSGETADGGARIIELTTHPFFIVTGFQPQMSSEPNEPHPLIVAFLQAAVKYRQK